MSFPRQPFAGPATAATLGVGVLGLASIAAVGGAVRGWALVGWAVAAASGIVGGAWVARAHGRPAREFLLWFSASMLARFAAYALGLTGAFRAGVEGVTPYLAGLAFGYLPVQAYEMIWFVRRTGGR